VACSLNEIGNASCGPCPLGTNGTGISTCKCKFKKKKKEKKKGKIHLLTYKTALCGNGICSDAIGENCVSCPQDCKQHACSKLSISALSIASLSIYLSHPSLSISSLSIYLIPLYPPIDFIISVHPLLPH
jgi:hypothetical protein